VGTFSKQKGWVHYSSPFSLVGVIEVNVSLEEKLKTCEGEFE
jgi:hypothetical protein